MFSKACEYGIRALTVIATASKKGDKIGIKQVCKLADTPESFTAKILQNLVKQDVITSQKGPSGGFYFERDLEKITLTEIVTAIDGKDIFYKCGLGLKECDAKRPCPLHNQFAEVRDGLVKMCANSTMKQLEESLSEFAYMK